MEFKVLTHVSKFTNDLVDKDFIVKNPLFSSLNTKTRKLPKLNSVQNINKNKIQFPGEMKMYETRGKQ